MSPEGRCPGPDRRGAAGGRAAADEGRGGRGGGTDRSPPFANRRLPGRHRDRLLPGGRPRPGRADRDRPRKGRRRMAGPARRFRRVESATRHPGVVLRFRVRMPETLGMRTRGSETTWPTDNRHGPFCRATSASCGTPVEVATRGTGSPDLCSPSLSSDRPGRRIPRMRRRLNTRRRKARRSKRGNVLILALCVLIACFCYEHVSQRVLCTAGGRPAVQYRQLPYRWSRVSLLTVDLSFPAIRLEVRAADPPPRRRHGAEGPARTVP